MLHTLLQQAAGTLTASDTAWQQKVDMQVVSAFSGIRHPLLEDVLYAF